MSKRPTGVRKSQRAYEDAKRASGEHIQINAILKKASDRELFERVRRRFPGASKAELVKRGLECLDGIACEEGVFELKQRPGRAKPEE